MWTTHAKPALAGHYRSESFTQRFPDRVLRLPYLPWTEYPAVIARCHAVLAPIAALTTFTHSKSALKYFESGILGVPVIASPIAEMRDTIEDGVNGWLATTPEEWTDRIDAALDTDKSLKVGKRARQNVLAAHTGHAVKGQLSALLRGIAKKTGFSIARAPQLQAPCPPPRSFRETARSYKRMGIYLFKHPLVWTIPAPPDLMPLDLLASANRNAEGYTAEAAELVLETGSLSPAQWEFLTIEIRIKPNKPGGYNHLQIRFQESGSDAWLTAPALAQQIAPLESSQAHRVNLRVLPKSMLDVWASAKNVRRIKLALDAGLPFALKTLALHRSASQVIPGARPAFLRLGLAARFLRDEGIEIGALHNPLPMPDCANVKYLDVLTKAQALAHYPELSAAKLVDPDIIDNAQELAAIKDAAWNFCVANHVLEHTRKPLTALRNWLRVLKPGGILYVSIPDCSNKLDRKRPVTTFEHQL